LIPFDILPHIIPMSEWRELHAGLKQRVRALNLFLHDVYHDQEILKAGHIPKAKVLDNAQFRKEMQGIEVPNGIYAHIAGVDLVRAGKGEYYVLEDNLRTPSGVSYMLEDRKMMMRLVPELFAQQHIRTCGALPGFTAGHAAQRCADRRVTTRRRAAHARPVQLGLLRTRFPGAADGCRVGRRGRSVCQRQLRLHAHDQWSAASGCGVPPHR
jgi:hypothetical protein